MQCAHTGSDYYYLSIVCHKRNNFMFWSLENMIRVIWPSVWTFLFFSSIINNNGHMPKRTIFDQFRRLAEPFQIMHVFCFVLIGMWMNNVNALRWKYFRRNSEKQLKKSKYARICNNGNNDECWSFIYFFFCFPFNFWPITLHAHTHMTRLTCNHGIVDIICITHSHWWNGFRLRLEIRETYNSLLFFHYLLNAATAAHYVMAHYKYIIICRRSVCVQMVQDCHR